MCGIAGIVRHGGVKEGDRAALQRMVTALSHRGPDDEGIWLGEEAAIGMRRLSVIDLACGHQPMANEDESIWVVFNGEIYNHQPLRAGLEATGNHRFRTRSDTEVLLHLYEDAGRALPASLDGMFAFCIVDVGRRTVLLARDHFGEKPLFYSASGGAFTFSSELASLLEAPWISRQADPTALRCYLESGFVRAPATAFRDIRELLPGHWLEVREGQLVSGPVERMPRSPAPAFHDDVEAAEALRATIRHAVKRQMVADVPIGAFLSGGIDSSTVAAAMQLESSRPVKTFTARFEYAPYDESPIAGEVARHLGTEHSEIFIRNGGFEEEDLRRITLHVGQPFSDSSAIPTYFVCREIRQHVKVCLSGDGGDEMFAGYPLFRWLLQIDAIAELLPAPVSRMSARLSRRFALLPGLDRVLPVRRAWKAMDAAAVPAWSRLSHVSRLFSDEELDQLCRPAVLGHPARTEGRTAPGNHGKTSRLRMLMRERVEGSLREDMLVKVDRMSMAASLEVRAPMLDVEVAASAAQLPDDLLIRRGVGKYILREAVKGWLPKIVFDHPKTGFSIPLHMFQNAAYESVCRDLLLSERVPLVRDLFDARAVNGIVDRGLSQKRDTGERSTYRSSHQLWALLNLAAWADEFGISA